MSTTASPLSTESTHTPRRVALASAIGTTIEWYDFYLYATATALVFNQLFFPSISPTAGTLAAFATYAAGFGARPIGAVISGHLGDRLGRKAVLIAALVTMGVATTAIGLLPTYATIGVWAPALLVVLRIVQGLAVGGEWAGAAILAVEHAPERRRGFFGSFTQLGSPAGMLLATGSLFLVRVDRRRRGVPGVGVAPALRREHRARRRRAVHPPAHPGRPRVPGPARAR